MLYLTSKQQTTLLTCSLIHYEVVMQAMIAKPSELEFVIEDNGGDLIMFCSLITDPDYDQHLDVLEFDNLGWDMCGELMWEKTLDSEQTINALIKFERKIIEALGAVWNPQVSGFM